MGIMWTHRARRGYRGQKSISPTGRKRYSTSIRYISPETLLNEEKNNPEQARERQREQHTPTMTGASVHVPHLLCPASCCYHQRRRSQKKRLQPHLVRSDNCG